MVNISVLSVNNDTSLGEPMNEAGELAKHKNLRIETASYATPGGVRHGIIFAVQKGDEAAKEAAERFLKEKGISALDFPFDPKAALKLSSTREKLNPKNWAFLVANKDTTHVIAVDSNFKRNENVGEDIRRMVEAFRTNGIKHTDLGFQKS